MTRDEINKFTRYRSFQQKAPLPTERFRERFEREKSDFALDSP